ncbi:MAG: hypothetical protein WC728_14390 [Elusimicrobiota bacterium]
MTGLFALALAVAGGPDKLLQELKAAPSPLPAGAVAYLLRAGAVDAAVSELEAILSGPSYDPVAGGRISSSGKKRLDENARFAIELLEVYQASKRPEFAEAARQTLDFILRDGKGADLWDRKGVEKALGSSAAEVFLFRYAVPETPGRVRTAHSVEETAAHFGRTSAEVNRLLRTARKRLLERVRPARPLGVSRSGLVMSALAKGFQVLEDPEYLKAARKVRGGKDAFFAQGLLDLYEASFDPDLLDRALSLSPRASDDPAVVCSNLLRLAQIYDRPDLRQAAQGILAEHSKRMEQEPSAVLPLMAAAEAAASKPKQIVIAGSLDDPGTLEMLRLVNGRFIPGRVLIAAPPGPVQQRLAKHLPALRGMVPIGGKPTAYICVDFSCELPTNDLKVAARLLDGGRP